MRKASFGEIPDSQRVEEVPEDNIQFRFLVFKIFLFSIILNNL